MWQVETSPATISLTSEGENSVVRVRVCVCKSVAKYEIANQQINRNLN